MARRGWTRSIIAAVLASSGSAAAQLGLGYGLGILVWAPNEANAAVTRGAWWAALAWTTWVAATSVVVGAVVGDRYGGRSGSGLFVRVGRRVVMALAATIGGLVTVPLVAIPARGAQVVDNYAPEILAGVFAATGVVLGLVVALLALVARAIAANVFLSAIWLWALATVVVVDGLTSGRGIEYAQLGVWKFTEGGPSWRSIYIPGALLMLGAALLIGGLAAFPAAGRSDSRVGVAASGAIGPLLLAVAYVLASPRAGEAPAEMSSAFAVAPYTVIAGLAGSLLVALVGGVPTRKTESAPREMSTTEQWLGHPNGSGAAGLRPAMSGLTSVGSDATGARREDGALRAAGPRERSERNW
jgi:hypothetical protein